MTWTAFFWKRNCTGMWPQQAGQGGSGGATVAECGHNKQAREAQAGQVSPQLEKNQSCSSQIDKCPSSTSGNRLSQILLFEANKKNNR